MFICLIDHAHPEAVVGHGFKGGHIVSQGHLQHPDMKRFAISSPFLFAPPRPNAWVNAATMGAVATTTT